MHNRRQPRVIVLDMASSENPTYGEQEGSAYNGHFGCTCYHLLFVFNQLGDLERSALRPGTASASMIGAVIRMGPTNSRRSAPYERKAASFQRHRAGNRPLCRLPRRSCSMPLLDNPSRPIVASIIWLFGESRLKLPKLDKFAGTTVDTIF